MDQIKVVCLQALEAAYQSSHEPVTGAIRNFGGEPNVFASGGHQLTNPGLTFAVAVSIRSIEIGDAQVDRVIQSRQGFFFIFVHQEATTAAKGEDRHLGARASERARGQWLRSRLRDVVKEPKSRTGGCSQSNSFKKFSAGEVFGHGRLLMGGSGSKRSRSLAMNLLHVPPLSNLALQRSSLI